MMGTINTLIKNFTCKNVMRPSKSVLFVLFMALLLAGCNFSLAADVTPPPGYRPPPVETAAATPVLQLFPLVPPDPAKGQATFMEKCAPCHGNNGLGDGPRAAQLPNPVMALGAPDVYQNAAPAQWFRIVTEGNLERFMPPFPSLSDRERWDVVAYALSMAVPAQRLVQGADIYEAYCANCHGLGGHGDGPDAPGPMPDFSDQEYMASHSAADFFQAITNGAGTDMPAFGEKLSDDERYTLADYLRSLSFASTVASAATTEPQQAEATMPSAGATLTGTETITSTAAISPTVPLGVVSGTVTSASGSPIPSGLDVNLHAFDQMTIVFTDTTKLKEDGTYAFENIEMPNGRGFLTTLEYDGVIYGSDISVVENNTQIDLPIEVYETTTDPSILVVDRAHYFFDFLDKNTLQVIELLIISNPTSKTLIAPKEGEPVVTFPLPTGATNLQFQDGELGGRYLSTENGFGDTVPVRPGSGNYQVVYSYDLPYDGKLDFVRPAIFPTNAIVILSPAGSIKVKGEGIQDAGVRDMQGVQYQMYNGSNLKAGDELHLTITGKPASAAPAFSKGSANNLVIGVGAFGLVLIFIGAWLYLRNKPLSLGDENQEGTSQAVGESTEATMDAILALDDLYQEGKLPEEAYLRRRAQLKASLKSQLDQADSKSGGEEA
jgi:mono/diheme cytochrome c family protein